MKSRKISIYFVIVLIVVFAGYQTLMNYKPVHESDRHKEYIEANKHPLNASDSTCIETFYTKLCVVNNTVSNDTLETKAFSNVGKSDLSKDFKPHLCTKKFLDVLCNNPGEQKSNRSDLKDINPWPGEAELLNNIDVYLGLESFSYNISHKIWNGSVKSEISHFEKDVYLMVVEFSEMTPPDFDESTESFGIGHCKGNVKVVNINTGELVAAMAFFAQNDESIKSIHLVKNAMDGKLKENLSLNIHKELSRCALALFNKPLYPKETEMYE